MLGAGVGLLGSILGNVGRKGAQDRARRKNLKQWNRQNLYDSPTEQMKRLREAGLNPNLIYGTSPSSAVGSSEKIAPAQAEEYDVESPTRSMSQFADVAVKQAQTNNLKKQNDLIIQQEILTGNQAEKVATETARNKLSLGYDPKMLKGNLQALEENVRILEQKTWGSYLDNKYKSGGMASRLKKILYEAKHAQANYDGKTLQIKMDQIKHDLRVLGVELTDPWWMRQLGIQYKGKTKEFIKSLPNRAFRY